MISVAPPAHGELLAELVVNGGDFPWLNAEVRPTAGFAEIRPLFDDEIRRVHLLEEEPEQWEAAYRRVREAVRSRLTTAPACVCSVPARSVPAGNPPTQAAWGHVRGYDSP